MNGTTFDEAAVALRARNGDRAAFGALVRTYQRRAYVAAYGFVGNREDALELAQEAFAKAYKAMGRFDARLPFYPWLHRIVRNTCLNHLKKRRRRGETSFDRMVEHGFDVKAPGPDGNRAAALDELRETIGKAMAALSPEHREILMLRHFQELSYAEIAQCLGIPDGTVMSRLHGARRALRAQLTKRLPFKEVV